MNIIYPELKMAKPITVDSNINKIALSMKNFQNQLITLVMKKIQKHQVLEDPAEQNGQGV